MPIDPAVFAFPASVRSAIGSAIPLNRAIAFTRPTFLAALGALPSARPPLMLLASRCPFGNPPFALSLSHFFVTGTIVIVLITAGRAVPTWRRRAVFIAAARLRRVLAPVFPLLARPAGRRRSCLRVSPFWGDNVAYSLWVLSNYAVGCWSIFFFFSFRRLCRPLVFSSFGLPGARCVIKSSSESSRRDSSPSSSPFSHGVRG